MRIENTIRIIDGLLQNFPSVDHTESIKINPQKIKRGDLFLDIEGSAQDQKTALDNGAYGIISEKIQEVLDPEIAWIEVDSMRLACVKLARYEFSKKNSKIIYLDDISQEILQSITKNHEFIALSSNVAQTLMAIKKSGENVKYSCSDERLAYSIDPYCEKIDNKFIIKKFKEKSPFYSSFICGDEFYNNIKIPTIFADKICQIVAYLRQNSIDFNLKNGSLSRHFSPLFIDFNLNKKEFGQSEKVLIFENSMDFLDFEIKYLSIFSQKLIICVPRRYINYFKNRNISFFSNLEELKNLIRKNCRYILILGEKEEYDEIFKTTKPKNRSLF